MDTTCKPKMLVVDDMACNIQLLTRFLSDAYAISVARDGEQALAEASCDPGPDIILLDINMPVMNGYEVCRRLKSNQRTSHIPVIFLTALEGEEEERRGLELGAADYISKPYVPCLVRARLHNHLELKRYRDRLEALVQERTREVNLTQFAAIFGLGILAEYRDPETGSHIKRTQSYVRLLSWQLREHPRFRGYFDDGTIRLICDSAPLHDIGKVGVCDSILLKPGKLTAEEFEQMKLHTVIGRDTICQIQKDMHDDSAAAFLHFAEELTYTHHEHWDGSGYHGLKGDQIPVSGRIMALADVYDALTSKRTYKPAFPHEKAFEIITNGDGRTGPEHFDPDVLQAFVDLQYEFATVSATYRD